MIKRLCLVLGPLLAASLLVACGEEELDEKTLSSLSADEKKTVCDYSAEQWGGYGKSKDCGGGLTVEADKDLAECLKDLPANCSAKVSDVKKCLADIPKMICTATTLPASCTSLPAGCLPGK